jgi:hypothetical protein
MSTIKWCDGSIDVVASTSAIVPRNEKANIAPVFSRTFARNILSPLSRCKTADIMSEITFERARLYEEVWTTPLTRLGEKYGLSDNGIRKVCKALNIPLPSHGHWARWLRGTRCRAYRSRKKRSGRRS